MKKRALGAVVAAQVLFLPHVQYGAPLRISGGLAVFVPVGETRTEFRQGIEIEGSGGQGGASGPDGTVLTWGAALQLPHYFRQR